MSDLPSSSLLQQASAKNVSGEHLEVLGKSASALWLEGRAKSLTEAVVETVKQAGLSPEQVKRVVEFANTDAYLSSFKKEGSGHKFVSFGNAGPADPAEILQDLNDGGGGTVFDPGTGDYNQPPREKTAMEKCASVDDGTESAFWDMFHAADPALPQAQPFRNTIDLRDKLANAYDQATSQLSMLENMFGDLRTRQFNNVKQAALAGHALSEIVEIWNEYAPSEEHVKVAFSALIDELVTNGVFASGEDVAASLQKVAQVGVVDVDHPLVSDFRDFCDVLSKLAEVREEQQAAGLGLLEINENLKVAEGLVQKGIHHLDRAAAFAGQKGDTAGRALLGPQGKHLGTAAKAAVYAAPVVGAHEVYRHTLKHNPAFQAVKNTALSTIPGTSEYNQKELELQMSAQGMGGMGY